MSSAHGVVHDDGVPRTPSISTRHKRHDPVGRRESVEHSDGTATPARRAARSSDVPAGTVTREPSIVTLTSPGPVPAGVPRS